MRRPPYLLEALIVLVIWAGIVAFIIRDTPMIVQTARAVSPSWWHYLDTIDPREDTAHYIN
jgi:hypothetical protein